MQLRAGLDRRRVEVVVERVLEACTRKRLDERSYHLARALHPAWAEDAQRGGEDRIGRIAGVAGRLRSRQHGISVEVERRAYGYVHQLLGVPVPRFVHERKTEVAFERMPGGREHRDAVEVRDLRPLV